MKIKKMLYTLSITLLMFCAMRAFGNPTEVPGSLPLNQCPKIDLDLPGDKPVFASADKAKWLPCPDGSNCLIGAFPNGGNHGSVNFYLWAVNKEGVCKIVWKDHGWLRAMDDISVEKDEITLPTTVKSEDCNAGACLKAVGIKHKIQGSFEKGYQLVPPYQRQK